MHGQFIRETTENFDKEKMWQLLSKDYLKDRTKALLCDCRQSGQTI